MIDFIFLFVTVCPDGWVNAWSVNLGCLFFETSKYISWTEAKQHCESLNNGNAHLIEIFSDEQMTFLVNTNEIKQKTYWWTGLNNEESSNEFKWDHSKLKLNFTLTWYPGYPKKKANSHVRLNVSNGNYKWVDLQGDTNHPICQFP